MIHLPRVALEIKTIGLYDLVLQDVQKIAGKNNLNEDEILEIMKTNPQILEDYMQINVEYNLSNIHLSDIDISKINNSCQTQAKEVNKNLNELREIEKYFFVLFSVQYFIVLLDLKEWQILIYSIFASSIVAAWMYAQKEKKKYATNNERYKNLYQKTLELISNMENKACINKSDLIIEECEEHV